MKLRLQNVGQLRDATVEFGDLTVLVGPQASGKSIFLQFLKLCLDSRRIVKDLTDYGMDWQGQVGTFLSLYLGEGMGAVWQEGENPSALSLDGKGIDLAKRIGPRAKPRGAAPVFYIPAQRVLSLGNGWPRPFSDFGAGAPYALRTFSESLRRYVEALGYFHHAKVSLFSENLHAYMDPQLQEHLCQTLLAGFELRIQLGPGGQKRLILAGPNQEALPFMAWSSGQREFVPFMLMMTALEKPKPAVDTTWVIAEELEEGLHPRAIASAMLSILRLLSNGYQVALSTHSPHVLDIVWGLRIIGQQKGTPDDVLDLFGFPSRDRTSAIRQMARDVLDRNCRVYYFDREPGADTTDVRDISGLNPGSESPEEAGWGGLTEFSGRVGDVVARVVNAAEARR